MTNGTIRHVAHIYISSQLLLSGHETIDSLFFLYKEIVLIKTQKACKSIQVVYKEQQAKNRKKGHKKMIRLVSNGFARVHKVRRVVPTV